MARLNPVSDQSASPDVRAVYDRVKNRFGKQVEPITIAAIHPDIFKAYIAYEASFCSASGVNGALKERRPRSRNHLGEQKPFRVELSSHE